MGGVAGESMSDSVWQTTRLRFTWLLANLVTAILASVVISMFEATIEQADRGFAQDDTERIDRAEVQRSERAHGERHGLGAGIAPHRGDDGH